MDRPIPLKPQIVEEASDWFIEFSEGTLDADARARFDAWLRRSPEHVEAYLKIATLWEEAPGFEKGRLAPAEELIARVRAEGNVIAFEKRDLASPALPPHIAAAASADDIVKPLLRRRTPLAAMAASFFLAALGTTLWFFADRSTYATGIGEQRSVRLDDGSTVDLNAESKIRVRFVAGERRLELLKGQALFRVAKDAARPFVVLTDNTQVRAVGTEFDVDRRQLETVVTVLEGRVAVLSEIDRIPERSIPAPVTIPEPSASAAGAPTTHLKASHAPLEAVGREILVAAGEQVRVSQASVSTPQTADLPVVTAWTQRKIAFKGSPLSDVVEEFNRNNPRPLVIADPTLSGTKISGVFSSTDPESLLRFQRSRPDIEVEERAQEIRISRR